MADSATYMNSHSSQSSRQDHNDICYRVIIRTVSKGYVPVSDVIEEVDLVLIQHQACCDGVYRSVAPSFVEEAAVLV